MTNTLATISHQYRSSCGTPSSSAMDSPARTATAAVRTVVTVTAVRAVQATSAASGSPGGIGIARSSEAVQITLIRPTTEVKTANKPNSAGSYNRLRTG